MRIDVSKRDLVNMLVGRGPGYCGQLPDKFEGKGLVDVADYCVIEKWEFVGKKLMELTEAELFELYWSLEAARN